MRSALTRDTVARYHHRVPEDKYRLYMSFNSIYYSLLIKESHLNTLLGDCRNEDLIDYIFGSVTDFARLIEEHGDEFSYEDITIKYDSDKDIHYFYKNEHSK